LEVGKGGVALDDVGEGGVFQVEEGWSGEGVFEPEAIAVAGAGELVDENGAVEGAEGGARDVVFGEATDPEVDVVDVAVEGLELGLERGVRGDLCKLVTLGSPKAARAEL
jgi:hypothetical protein